jgi:hypothetical protein
MERQEQKNLLLQIPKNVDDTIKLYVDGEFVNRLNVNQVCQYRYDILKYIYETEDSSILDRFYFIGHQDTNDKPGEEIKIQMDIYGNFSNSPYELNYVRRYMMEIMRMERNNIETIKKIQNK